MLKRFRSAAIGLGALFVAGGIAFAAGNYSTYPIVGEGSFCISTVSGAGGFNADGNVGGGGATGQGQASSGSLCAQTVPAGPASTTGNELIAADTGLPGGASPQTVTLRTVLLGAGAVNYQTPLTGASITANPNESTMLIDPAGTIATLTVVMPGPAASLHDGQTWRLTSSQTVTALTLTAGSGETVSNAPSAITISTTTPYGYEFIWKASNSKWYRIQ